MFYSPLAMMFATIAASQDAPGFALAAAIDLETEAQDEAKSYVALMEGKDAGVKTGLRGANANGLDREEPKTWRYEKVTMEASVQHTIVAHLMSGSGDSWGREETVTEQTRTTRRNLYEQVKENYKEMSKTVEASMEVGASFPIKVVSVDVKASSGFSETVTTGIKDSSRSVGEYTKETDTSMSEKVSHHYTANPESGQPDKVVYREVWRIGNRPFKKVYLVCEEGDIPKNEVEKVEMTVAVDYMWHSITNKWNEAISAGGPASRFGFANSVSPNPHAYDQQWAFSGKNGKFLTSRSGKYLSSVGKAAGGFVMFTDGSPPDTRDTRWEWTRDDTLRNGRGYCMQSQTTDTTFYGVWIRTVDCGSIHATKWKIIDACPGGGCSSGLQAVH